MAADFQTLSALVDRFLDAYGEDLVKQLRELRFYPNQAAPVDRLLIEKDEIIARMGALKGSPLYRVPGVQNADTYRDFLFQVEGLVRRRIAPHLDEIRKIIGETQVRSGYRNRMSWEVVKTRINLLGQLADEVHAALRDYFRVHFLPDLAPLAAAAPVPGALHTQPQSTPVAAVRIPFPDLLLHEHAGEDDARVYDDALKAMEHWYAKEQGPEAKGFAMLSKRLGDGVKGVMNDLFPASGDYRSVLKPGYVSLDEFRSVAESFETLGNRMKLHLTNYGDGTLRRVEYEGVDGDGNPRRRAILYTRLFRNLEMHLGLIRLIRADAYYDVAYYLYYRPAYEHWHELKLLLDKVVLPRVPLRERYNPDLKFTGHLFNELKSQLDVFHDQLRRHF